MAGNLLSRGEIFAGRYRIERSIGAGGMGAVFEAEHIETERRVALKVLLPQSLMSDGARERFKQEARVAGKIRHPNIVDVLDAGVDDGTNMPYLVMELLHGEDLASRVDRLGPLTTEETVALLAQAANALDCLHERSIVHRDLKPENLFLTWAEDGTPVTKLLDFGVAKVIAEGKSSALTDDAQGTPVYMAPEQFAEQIRISPATDIYALGMVAFMLLTGGHYWGAEIERGMNVFMLARIAEGGPKEPATVRAAKKGVTLPASFDAWFSIVTALAPGERYPTAGDAVSALADALRVPFTTTLPDGFRARMPPRPSPLAQPQKSAPELGASATTPPIPLQRSIPLWRRPTTLAAGLIALGLIGASAIFAASRPPVRDGDVERPPPRAALSSVPAAPSESAPPAAGAVPSLRASASATPSAEPTTTAAPSTTLSVPATGSASRSPRTPAQPLPTSTKKPKYTRD